VSVKAKTVAGKPAPVVAAGAAVGRAARATTAAGAGAGIAATASRVIGSRGGAGSEGRAAGAATARSISATAAAKETGGGGEKTGKGSEVGSEGRAASGDEVRSVSSSISIGVASPAGTRLEPPRWVSAGPADCSRSPTSSVYCCIHLGRLRVRPTLLVSSAGGAAIAAARAFASSRLLKRPRSGEMYL